MPPNAISAGPAPDRQHQWDARHGAGVKAPSRSQRYENAGGSDRPDAGNEALDLALEDIGLPGEIDCGIAGLAGHAAGLG